MTPHQRFLATMHFQPVDRPPLWEWGPWPSTLRRWQRERLGEEQPVPELAEAEPRVQCGVDLWRWPPAWTWPPCDANAEKAVAGPDRLKENR